MSRYTQLEFWGEVSPEDWGEIKIKIILSIAEEDRIVFLLPKFSAVASVTKDRLTEV